MIRTARIIERNDYIIPHLRIVIIVRMLDAVAVFKLCNGDCVGNVHVFFLADCKPLCKLKSVVRNICDRCKNDKLRVGADDGIDRVFCTANVKRCQNN